MQCSANASDPNDDNFEGNECAVGFVADKGLGYDSRDYMALRNAFENEATIMLWHMKLMCDFGANLAMVNNANEDVRSVLKNCCLTCTMNHRLGGVCFNAYSLRTTHIPPTPRTFCTLL